jgi:hypothetical protein
MGIVLHRLRELVIRLHRRYCSAAQVRIVWALLIAMMIVQVILASRAGQ